MKEKATGQQIIFQESLNPFPSGTYIVHEYTKNGEYAKTCMEYSIMGFSSASNRCVGPNGLLPGGDCKHDPDLYEDPKQIRDTKKECKIPVADGNNVFPAPVAGCEYTEFMARHGFKTCSSTANSAKDQGCKFHVHTYTLDTQSGSARDAACLGYVAGHYDPLDTKTVCENPENWSKCEQGDLSGKWGKLNWDNPENTALKADKESNEKYNLNVFTRGTDGDEGAFSRALVFHSPADDGGEAWFCVTLGKSCTAVCACSLECHRYCISNRVLRGGCANARLNAVAIAFPL